MRTTPWQMLLIAIAGDGFDDTAAGANAGSAYIFNLDCNDNGIFDWIDIHSGSPDINYNGVPDSCEEPPSLCLADVFPPCGDSEVSIMDFLTLLAAWGPCGACPADLDGDGFVGITDFLDLLAAWGPCQ